LKQILIVNSRAESRFKPFLEKVFLAVQVGTVWEEYENIGGKNPIGDFRKQAAASDALFLILSREAQTAFDARNLGFFESGFSRGRNVYVFEHCEDSKRVSIRIPDLHHFISLYITNAWTDHVIKIAEAFEESRPGVVPFAQGDLVPLVSTAVDSFFDPQTGQALFDHSTSQPLARKVACPYCAATYTLHIPDEMTVIRCPACGGFSEIRAGAKAPRVSGKFGLLAS
jgi:hypothetical protein